MARRTVHASAHSTETVPPGYAKALCGELVPVHEVRIAGVTCGLCLQVAANTLRSAAAIAGRGHGAAGRTVARAERRAGRRVGGQS